MNPRSFSLRLSAAVVATLVSIPGCGDSPANRMFDPGSPLVVEVRAEDENGIVRSRFNAGQPIRFILDIRNQSPGPVEVRFLSHKVFDFIVLNDNDATVWVWSANRSFQDAVTRLTFDPATTETVQVTWDQIRFDGRRAFRGRYRVWGLLPADDGDLESRPVVFRIE